MCRMPMFLVPLTTLAGCDFLFLNHATITWDSIQKRNFRSEFESSRSYLFIHFSSNTTLTQGRELDKPQQSSSNGHSTASIDRDPSLASPRKFAQLFSFIVAASVSFSASHPSNALTLSSVKNLQYTSIETAQLDTLHDFGHTFTTAFDSTTPRSIGLLPSPNPQSKASFKAIGPGNPRHPQTTVTQQKPKPPPRPQPRVNQSTTKVQKPERLLFKNGEFQPIDVKKIADENKIEVELLLKDQSGTVKIDRETFRKVITAQPKFLQYLPSSVQPLITRQFQSLKVLKEIPDDQLFEASVLAGSITEMVRTTVTYPLGAVKARVQARRSKSSDRRRPRSLLRKFRITWLTFVFETKRGNLYAGILPTLLITIPASGVYSGVKEVSRRAFSMGIQSQFVQSLFPNDGELSSYVKALIANLLSALVADVASLAVRTPADVLALRLQVFGRSNVRSDFTDWAKDSVLLLPAMVLTDLPYLMSRIFLNAAIATSGDNLGKYEVETIFIACFCAFLTTPFDVARTRILLPTLPSEEMAEKRLVGSSRYREQRRKRLNVILTMKRIATEGNGGVENLFAGWLERTVFLGLGRAWLDPLRVIGYLGLRDAILLKFFE